MTDNPELKAVVVNGRYELIEVPCCSPEAAELMFDENPGLLFVATCEGVYIKRQTKDKRKVDND